MTRLWTEAGGYVRMELEEQRRYGRLSKRHRQILFRVISFAVRRIYVIFAGELIPIGFSKIK